VPCCLAGAGCPFHATSSTGPIASYAWDFGDGTKASGPYVSHIYAPAWVGGATTGREATVSLCVADSGGRSECTSTKVAVVLHY